MHLLYLSSILRLKWNVTRISVCKYHYFMSIVNELANSIVKCKSEFFFNTSLPSVLAHCWCWAWHHCQWFSIATLDTLHKPPHEQKTFISLHSFNHLLYSFLSFYGPESLQCFSQNNLGKTYFLNWFWLTSTEMG